MAKAFQMRVKSYETSSYWPAIVSMAGKGCILIAFALALSPSPAQAECGSWDVGGQWFIQAGGNHHQFHLTQDKLGVITGLATQGTTRSSKVNGRVLGSAFSLHLVSKGLELRGDIAADGKIHGVLHDLSDPSKKSVFASSRAMKCTTQFAAPAPPQKPVKTTPPAPAPPKTQASTTAPTISAHPTTVTIPDGQSQGTVTLTWDGGPDHPYAEVWMKEGSQGEEKFLVEQGKGTRQVTVERGKNYMFILTDSGKQLAKAVVISKR